jgi:hypothetical protein
MNMLLYAAASAAVCVTTPDMFTTYPARHKHWLILTLALGDKEASGHVVQL